MKKDRALLRNSVILACTLAAVLILLALFVLDLTS